jgi:hypothetical protein
MTELLRWLKNLYNQERSFEGVFYFSWKDQTLLGAGLRRRLQC